MLRVKRTEEEVCQLPKPEDILFPEQRTYSAAKLMCEKVGGKLTVVDSDQKLKKLVNIFKKKKANKAEDGRLAHYTSTFL